MQPGLTSSELSKARELRVEWDNTVWCIRRVIGGAECLQTELRVRNKEMLHKTRSCPPRCTLTSERVFFVVLSINSCQLQLIHWLIHGNNTLDTCEIMKTISQADTVFKTCPIPHQRLNFQKKFWIWPNVYIIYTYASMVRGIRLPPPHAHSVHRIHTSIILHWGSSADCVPQTNRRSSSEGNLWYTRMWFLHVKF